MSIFRPRRGFTLVEMLVVIAIIAVLAALLLPAVMMAITTARNAAIALEIRQIDIAIEAYRLEKGDYPPNFRDMETVRRHITKCYPKINPTYFNAFMMRAFPLNSGTPVNPFPATATTLKLDEAESLVFWLSMTDTNQQYPFLSYLPWPQGSASTTAFEVNAKRYYDFDETRLVETTPAQAASNGMAAVNPLKSFANRLCKDTFYLYLDSRSYDRPLADTTDLGRFQAVDGSASYAFSKFDTSMAVRPYWTSSKNPNALSSGAGAQQYRNRFKPVNATSFQLICAGQDGDFGFDTSDPDVKVFNSGDNYTDGDKDNITNFSSGKTLGNSMP